MKTAFLTAAYFAAKVEKNLSQRRFNRGCKNMQNRARNEWRHAVLLRPPGRGIRLLWIAVLNIRKPRDAIVDRNPYKTLRLRFIVFPVLTLPGYFHAIPSGTAWIGKHLIGGAAYIPLLRARRVPWEWLTAAPQLPELVWLQLSLTGPYVSFPVLTTDHQPLSPPFYETHSPCHSYLNPWKMPLSLKT